MADYTQIYGPFYGGMLGKQAFNTQQAVSGAQQLGILSDALHRQQLGEEIRTRMDAAKANAIAAQEQQARMIDFLSQPDDVVQNALGIPAMQARSMFQFGGPGLLSKVMEEQAKVPEKMRLINALPEAQRPAALQAATGIDPKFHTVDQGGANIGFTYSPAGGVQQVFTAPKSAAPGAVPFQGSDMTPEQYRDFLLSQGAAGAPRVGVTVSTEKKYGEQFAGKVAESDVKLRDAAMGAPELAERANRIRTTLASGRVITGAGADARLSFGKAMGLVGASDAETIANTETLAASLAQNTLDSIKASGLGGGTGFSNADRDFLEKAVGGKITLESASLNRLAELAHRAASTSVNAWNKRAKSIPDSALEGTGVSRDPVQVPALTGGSPANIAPGEVRRGWRFRGGDPSNQLNWEKVK